VKGSHAARMEDIAREAGLSKATLYLYFKSKEDLALAIVEEFYSQAFYALPPKVARQKSAKAQLRAAFQLVSENLGMIKQMAPLTFEFIADAAREEKIRTCIQNHYRVNREGVIELIRLGIREGEFKEVDPVTIAIILGATFEGLILIQTIQPEMVNWSTLPDSVLDILFSGISK
jgi:AcrR family transcriptional regulator